MLLQNLLYGPITYLLDVNWCMCAHIFSPPKQALKTGKKVKLSHEEVMQKMGELFALR